jgi:hypothetical protein
MGRHPPPPTYDKEQANKLQNMDESEINDLALELEGPENSENKEKVKSLQKKKARVEARLAAEKKKKSSKKNAQNDDDDDDDDGDITTFAKGSRAKKKN